MKKTKPFATLANAAKVDPVRRERIAAYKRAITDALALAELRATRELTQGKPTRGTGRAG